MMNLNTKLQYPPKVKWYIITKISLILLLITIPFSLGGRDVWQGVFWFLAIFIGIPAISYKLLFYKSVSFLLEDNKITISYGIIAKKSDSIPFSNVQNANCVSGLMRRMFGLSTLNMWTASPLQISVRNQRSEHKPDGMLILMADDAEWLRNYITKK